VSTVVLKPDPAPKTDACKKYVPVIETAVIMQHVLNFMIGDIADVFGGSE
jgi:hypothetical protein